MEIERKFLIKKEMLPEHLEQYPHSLFQQAYIITQPVLRIRKKESQYILTYKGEGLMTREEIEFPLSQEAYEKLLTKSEGNILSKTRYRIPDRESLCIELDVFHGKFEGLFLAEVEFSSEEEALSYCPPAWFGKEVTSIHTFHNSNLSKMDESSIKALLSTL